MRRPSPFEIITPTAAAVAVRRISWRPLRPAAKVLVRTCNYIDTQNTMINRLRTGSYPSVEARLMAAAVSTPT
jgi:hypothetical protein